MNAAISSSDLPARIATFRSQCSQCVELALVFVNILAALSATGQGKENRERFGAGAISDKE